METAESIGKGDSQHTKPSVDSATQELSEIVALLRSIDTKLGLIVVSVREINMNR
jgi:hypothetical protein